MRIAFHARRMLYEESVSRLQGLKTLVSSSRFDRANGNPASGS